MQFLAPLFFLALAGLAIPVLLHLTQREKHQIVRFPSLMFVRRIPYQSVRRRKIQNWLLLMVRLAALALIILAFARPFIDREELAAVGTAAREVVVLLDASYSMGVGDRWSAAQAAANDQIGRLTASDRGSVVVFGTDASISLRSTAERSRLQAAVAAARPGTTATRYAPALKVAGSILAESSLPRREVVLISDFQQSGWRGEEGARLPEGTTLTPVAIQGPIGDANLSLTGVTLARTTTADRQRVVVTAGISNRTERAVAGGTIELEVGGLPVASEPLSVEPGGSASVTFEPFTLADDDTRGTVRLGEDALEADNTFRFVLSPSEPIHVLVIDRGNEASSLYLERVLSIGETPRFDRTSRRPDAVSEADLRASDVVIVHDVPVGQGLARRLAQFVEDGGGLLVAAGTRSTWPRDVELLPGSIDQPIDRTQGDAARVGGLEYGHPVFEPFRRPRTGDFSAIPVYGYRSLTEGEGAQILARFDAGSPALLERRAGRGRVLLWGTTLDLSWSDLPTRPVFPVFVNRAMVHLAGYAEPSPWLTVGDVLDAEARTPSTRPLPVVALTPSGQPVPFDEEGAGVMRVDEPGFYELRNDENETEVVVAVNVDPAEADLTAMDPNEIAVAAASGFAGPDGTVGGVPLTVEARERNQRLWWYLLCLGVLLLGVDTVLSNRMAKA